MKKVTIQDIAREAGVGKSTVSRVINGSGYVSSEVSQRVKAIMEKYRYQPSSAAICLSRQESDTIGVILPEVNNPFFADILKGITMMVERYGYTLMLCGSDNEPQRDLKALQAMCRQRIKGLIYIPACDFSDPEQFTQMKRLLEQLSCPVVLLDRTIEGLDYDSVTTDNFSGAYACTEALIQAGHKRIGIVAGNMELYIGRERYRGFCRALEHNGIPLLERDVIYGEFDTQITYEKARELLKGEDYPRAVFLSNNLSESGFLKAVFERRMRIPEDIAFVSFDQMPSQHIYNMPFSYLERNVQSLGEQAAQLLFKRFDLRDGPVQHVVIASSVILRGSEKKI